MRNVASNLAWSCVLVAAASSPLTAQCLPEQTAKLLPVEPGSGSGLRSAIAISADTLIATNDSWGVLGSEGIAYVYERDVGGQWSRTAELHASDTNEFKQFGHSVGLEGDLAVVGAGGWDLEGNDGAYAFRREPDGAWTFEAKIVPDDWTLYQYLSGVSLSGDTLLVTAPGDEQRAGYLSGAAYVFRRSPQGQWTQEAKLTASDGREGDSFGNWVSLSGDRAAVGMYGGPGSPGRFYIFERDDQAAWSERAMIPVPEFGGVQAEGVAPSVGGRTVVVNAYYPIDDIHSFVQTYVYRLGLGGVWNLEGRIAPTDWPENVPFSGTPSVREGMILIGDYGDDGHGDDSGITYVFARHADGTWTQSARFGPDANGKGDLFGVGIAMDATQAAILAPGDVNGEDFRGAAYVYDLPGCIPCPADCDASGDLSLFDFLCFVNAFNAEDPYADCNADSAIDLFDFLCFTNAFNTGC